MPQNMYSFERTQRSSIKKTKEKKKETWIRLRVELLERESHPNSRLSELHLERTCEETRANNPKNLQI